MSAKVARERICSNCLKRFSPTSNGQKVCPKCRIKLDARAKKVLKKTKRCVVCSTVFVAKSSTAKVCSISCRNSLNAHNINKNRFYDLRACDFCKKEYVPRSTHSKWCSESCRRKNDHIVNAEAYQKRIQRRISKNRIGLNIRDETLMIPTNQAKWLWDGVGRWSPKHWPEIQECLECNSTVYRHQGNGVCDYCYNKIRQQDPEKVKAWKKKSYERAKAAGKVFSAQQSRQWIARAKKAEIPITPKIENLLDNLERL